MNLLNTLKQDNNVMQTLNVSVLRRQLCDTNKGKLELQLRKGDTNYHLILDSVPLEKEVEKEVMDLLFKVEVPTVNKYPVDNKTMTSTGGFEPLEVNKEPLSAGIKSVAFPNILDKETPKVKKVNKKK